MTGPQRTERVSVYVTPEERARLRRSARGKGVSAHLREQALGTSAAAVRDADDWWAVLPPGRREQLHRWVTQVRSGGQVPGQDALPEFADLD